MLQVIPPITLIRKILGLQKLRSGISYRLTIHCLRVEQPEGVLLYHTLSGELLLLSCEEAALLEKLPGPIPSVLVGLVSSWFLRPEGADDMALVDQVRAIAEHFKAKESDITIYKILLTTACNARCFYCFEAGWKPRTMTEQIARDTARYIVAHCGGKPVRFYWFGGEPLVNARAIDVITDCLRQQGVEFKSEMPSNGYLFDKAMVRRARDNWNLKKIHITLDGTEEVYNRRKAYVNPEGSPYRRVLRNIGLLLDAGISVNVRLNMDADNERDLYALVDELTEQGFAEKRGFSVYSTVLWENEGSAPHSYTEEERSTYAQKRLAMLAYIRGKGILEQLSLEQGFAVNACTADRDNYTTVTPEGRLGRCTACEDGAIWGSIYSDVADEEVLRKWKERRAPEEACKTCSIYPQCMQLKNCPRSTERCTLINRSIRMERVRRAVLGAYEDWKTAGQP